jgi:hypothetical protein
MGKRKSAPDEGKVNTSYFHRRSIVLTRTLHNQMPLGLRRKRGGRSLLKLLHQVRRDGARILKVQMPPLKSVVLSSKRHVQRTSLIASPGSCHRGERSWKPIYVQQYGFPTRFFMIDRRREGEELCEEFKVLGSTGNVRWVQKCTEFMSFSLCCCC